MAEGVERSSTYQKICGLIPGSRSPSLYVEVSWTPNCSWCLCNHPIHKRSKLFLHRNDFLFLSSWHLSLISVWMGWMRCGVKHSEWSKRLQRALYKYSPYTISLWCALLPTELHVILMKVDMKCPMRREIIQNCKTCVGFGSQVWQHQFLYLCFRSVQAVYFL